MPIKNVDELHDFINTKLREHNVAEIERDTEVLWFVAMFEARVVVSDYSMKDIASMLQEGTAKIDDEYVDNWLVSLYESYETEDEAEQDIVRHIGYMYNINELSIDSADDE